MREGLLMHMMGGVDGAWTWRGVWREAWKCVYFIASVITREKMSEIDFEKTKKDNDNNNTMAQKENKPKNQR